MVQDPNDNACDTGNCQAGKSGDGQQNGPGDPPEPEWQDPDPDLPVLLSHADPGELDRLLPLARRFLEADGDPDWGTLPPGRTLIEGVYVLGGASYAVGGRGDGVFVSAMGFVLVPERLDRIVRTWRLAAGLGEEEIERRLRAVRKRREEEQGGAGAGDAGGN